MLRRILYTAVIICFVTIHVMALRKIDAMASARVAARPTISQFTD
jgi:Flp pilus assembly protein protease CpaA